MTQFQALQDTSVQVDGNIYELSVGNIPDGVTLKINEVVLKSGDNFKITENMALSATKAVDIATVTFNTANVKTATLNGLTINNGDVETLTGDNIVIFEGAVDIPSVTLSAVGLNSVSVNGSNVPTTQLPYTFTPLGGIDNSISVNGETSSVKRLSIAGTDVKKMTINGIEHALPYSEDVTENMTIAVNGETYVINVESEGAKIFIDGNEQAFENGQFIYDVKKDLIMTVDGNHEINLNGNYIKDITINGVVVPIDNLPTQIMSSNLVENLIVNGYTPSSITLTGAYLEDVQKDGATIPLNDGALSFNFETFSENININANGTQPREFNVTAVDNGTTVISANGSVMGNGESFKTFNDVLISAKSKAIPINFQSTDTVKVDINGREYELNEFSVSIDTETEIDILTETCKLTISYAENSYTLTVPQSNIKVTAPHRDGWVFSNWASADTGIDNPQSVMTNVNLSGKSSASLTCVYELDCRMLSPSKW